MSEYVHLVGAETVERAASTIRQAAADMLMAASMLSDIYLKEQIDRGIWLDQLKEALAEMEKMR